MEYERILVVCVDRDADIYRKAGERGPVIGRNNLLDTAVKLGLADPTEADTNALFETIKIGDELKRKGKEVEVTVLVGDKDVGITSDMELSKQLSEVLEKFEADGVILVTDGAEDEHILPIIQSKAKVISLKRVVVRQSEHLESTYYIIKDFLKEIVSDPKLSRLAIGLPGVAAILYMLFGQHGWRLIIGVIGVFLLVKGFGLEDTLQKGYDEIKASFIAGRISFFTYVVAVLIGTVGLIVGYTEVARRAVPYSALLTAGPIFLSESVDLLMLAAIIALIGKSIDSIVEQRGVWRYFLLIVFVVALRLIVDAVSLFLLGEISMTKFAVSILLGLILSIFSFSSIMAVRRPLEAEGS
ncbi:MAG: DUF373 family protein [Candidatus Hydrothermarchaeales archaeon]